MLVEAAHYLDGVKARSGELHEVAAEAQKAGGFVWAGLHEPTAVGVDEVAATFGLHPLAVEDAIVSSQRPKVERYGDWLFVVLKTARYLDEPEEIDFGEIQLFCAEHAIVVIRRGEPVPLAGVRRRLEAEPEALAGGPARVLHAVIDEVVDTYHTCLNGLDDDVSEVELEVFAPVQAAGPAATKLVERIYFLQREILELHRALHPLLASMSDLRADRLLRSDPGQDAYYRDVHDHLRLQADQLVTLRDLIVNALTANATRVSLQQNEDMRRISAWVAVVAVPTMIAGIYGMNFDHMPELGWTFGYPASLVLMVGAAVLLYRWFRRSGWL